MDFSTLKQLSKVYPILVKPFDLFDATTVTDQDIQTKIDSVIQYMNSLGQSNNDTVRSWNKVMQWVMDEGLTDSVNSKIDDMMANGTFNDLLTTLTNSLLGSEVLTTTNQDVKGAINEVKGIADANTLALGSEVLATTNKDVKGAINEVKGIADSNTSALAERATSLTRFTRNSLETDDTGRLQRAFNSIVNGGTLIIPQQTLTISNTVSMSIPAGANVSIIGIGNVQINSAMVEPASEVGLLSITGTPTSNLHIENINLAHNNTTTAQNLDGIFINNLNRLTMHKVNATLFSHWGIVINSVLSGIIHNCQAVNNRYGGFGIAVSSNIVVTGGSYSQNGTTAPTDGYGLSLKTSSTQGTYNQNILIQGVYAFNNKRKGIDVHSGHQITIKGNFVIGFGDGGIYAVNEGWDGSTAKEVKDIIITDNYVDGISALSSLYYGISIGSYGANSTDSGDFIISNNIIKNVIYSAIAITNPSTGGITSKKIIISSNTIEYGSGSGYSIIRGSSSGVNLDQVKIEGNVMHTSACTIPIEIDQLNSGSIINNDITVDSGTCSNGILFPSSSIMICTGNTLKGSATYTNPIPIAGSINGQMVKNNIVSGLAFRENVRSGISVEYVSSMPSTGLYYAGSIAWNLNATKLGTAGSQYIIEGWKRLTTSSTHVLNTDWIEMHSLTGQ